MSLKGAIRKAQRHNAAFSALRPAGCKLRHFRPGEKVRLKGATGFAPAGVYLCDYVCKHFMTLRTGDTLLGIGPMFAERLEKAPADTPLIPEPECRHGSRLIIDALREADELVSFDLQQLEL